MNCCYNIHCFLWQMFCSVILLLKLCFVPWCYPWIQDEQTPLMSYGRDTSGSKEGNTGRWKERKRNKDGQSKTNQSIHLYSTSRHPCSLIFVNCLARKRNHAWFRKIYRPALGKDRHNLLRKKQVKLGVASCHPSGLCEGQQYRRMLHFLFGLARNKRQMPWRVIHQE